MNALEQYATHRKNLELELKAFKKGMNTPAIEALSRKIYHMCEYLGSPNSVFDMLKSICNNVVKKYGGEDGKKKLGICNKKETFEENKQNPKIVYGHFRWDYGKAYLLTEKEIRYINGFYFKGTCLTPTFDPSNEHEAIAVNFINKHNVKFEIKLLRNGKYFNDDDKERNIYEITLTRLKNVYSFTFGQSIIGTENNTIPSFYDILVCLTKYDPGTFEDFCSEFGYDTDSKKAEKTYLAVKDEWLNVSRLFNDEELSELQEIQ